MADHDAVTWTPPGPEALPGRTIVITGGNSGVGFEAARALASAGAHVVLACRNAEKAQAAESDITAAGGSASTIALDLADLDSVAGAAKLLTDGYPRLDAVVANAGVMGGRQAVSAQGFELQMATNHLGHFAFLAQVWPSIVAAEGRAVVLSSIASRGGRLDADLSRDGLVRPPAYRSSAVYSNTKQANLLFAQELARRATAAGRPVLVAAAHPGVAWTNLVPRQFADEGKGWLLPLVRLLRPLIFQSAYAGALPIVRAVTDPELPQGAFVGPQALHGVRGRPELLDVFRVGRDQATAARLWELSEEITGVPFPV
jgi:NAD(P)-dependent dehydrogenase (short-subunit alcohol dehydrogenase family)